MSVKATVLAPLWFQIHTTFFHDVFIGASVAINGTCLTATHIDLTANQVHFDVSDLTRRLTTLGTLQAGDEVNIERSAKVGMENGGA